jgi:hypothetical protein
MVNLNETLSDLSVGLLKVETTNDTACPQLSDAFSSCARVTLVCVDEDRLDSALYIFFGGFDFFGKSC